MKQTKGFTLIELLVVIAIIGILSSVVLASLNSAREKGQVAKIKQELSSFRNQAGLFASNGGGYAGVCTDPTAASIIASLGNSVGQTNVTCTPAQGTYNLKVISGATTYCTDESGFIGTAAAGLSSGTCG